MSDKRYPTRMHEILTKPGEPPLKSGEMFALNTDPDDMDYYLTDYGDMFLRYGTANKTVRMANADEVLDAINHGITRRPRLTEEQVAMLRALRLLDMQYLTKNSSGTEMSAWKDKPGKGVYFWEGWYIQARLSDSVIAVIGDLVSWDDPYPLDIVQTLRDAGVEVDDG